MQKKIIALAIAAAFAAPVSAMAAAEIYGTVDIGYVKQTVSTGATDVKTSGIAGGSNAYTTNHWGFKNSEDLGDGMKANIQIESGFDSATGDGSAIGNRGISAGISAEWGAIVFGGNQYSTSFKVNKAVDPFGYKFIGITGMSFFSAGTSTDYLNVSIPEYLPSGGRNDRDVAYTGKFGDVTVMAGRTFNRKVDGVKNGDASAVGAVYAAGDLTVAASYTATDAKDVTPAVLVEAGGAFGATPAVTAPNALPKRTETSIGAAYKFGDATVNANRISMDEDGAPETMDTVVIGASYKVSDKVGVTAGMYKTDIGSVKVRNLKLVSATYALSKKTTMYAQYNTAKTSDDVNSSKGFGAGLSVSF